MNEVVMNERIARKLGMKGRCKKWTLPYEDRLAAIGCQHFDPLARPGNFWRADEDGGNLPAADGNRGIKRGCLPPIAVSLHIDVDLLKGAGMPREEDGPRAGAEDRFFGFKEL